MKQVITLLFLLVGFLGLSQDTTVVSYFNEITMGTEYSSHKEILKFNINELATRNQLHNAGIEMIDCGDDEIASAVFELVERLSGKWTDTEYNLDLQRRFKKIYSQWMGNQYVNGHKWHGDIIRANYSTNFLIKNIEWLNE